MPKSVSSEDYSLFVRLLRAERHRAGITQVALAARLQETQTFISKVERGERRIDVIELREICTALNISFTGFVKTLDARLK